MQSRFAGASTMLDGDPKNVRNSTAASGDIAGSFTELRKFGQHWVVPAPRSEIRLPPAVAPDR